MILRNVLAAGVLVLAATGSALAAPVVYTYSGAVSSLSDPAQLTFGGAFGIGDAFTVKFTRDDATPSVNIYSFPYPFANSGIESVVQGSPVTAVLTIGSFSYDFGANPGFTAHSGHQRQTDYTAPSYEEFSHGAVDSYFTNSGVVSELGYASIQFVVSGAGTNYLANGDYHSLGDLTAAGTPGFDWSGTADFGYQAFNRASGNEILALRRIASIGFETTSLTVGSVPEPATWALMIGGFGMVGGMLRRRRSVTA